MKTSLTIILTVIIGFLIAQNDDHFNKPYILFSESGDFYLRSIPFNEQPIDQSGITSIFNSKSDEVVYSISRYFNSSGIALSNDGQSVLCIEEYIIMDEEHLVLYYRNGELIKTYCANQFVDRIDKKHNNFHYKFLQGEVKMDEHYEVFVNLAEKPIRVNQDYVYYASSNSELVVFDLNTGIIEQKHRIDINFNEDILRIDKRKFNWIEHQLPLRNGFPELINGKAFSKVFEERFGFKKCITTNGFFGYYLEFSCVIDNTGSCIDANVDFSDSTLNSEIERFLLKLRFNKDVVKDPFPQWHFYHNELYRLADLNLAKKEFHEFLEKNRKKWQQQVKRKSINGNYIPKNINDCFRELDKFLSNDQKDTLKQVHRISFFEDLEIDLIEKWSLREGSRLQKYFLDLGINDHQKMAHIIVETYYRNSTNQDIRFHELIEKHKSSEIDVYESIWRKGKVYK